MHGAGLTHMLFLPEWAGVFELYDCGDPGCYSDLARLSGLSYTSWDREELLYPAPDDPGNHRSGHAKFNNYAFDPEEFERKVEEIADMVVSHPKYVEAVGGGGVRDEL